MHSNQTKVWNDLKRDTIGARNKSELITKISRWWNNKKNDLEYCNKKSDHLERVVDMCIAMEGQSTCL